MQAAQFQITCGCADQRKMYLCFCDPVNFQAPRVGVFSVTDRELKLERLLVIDEGCGVVTTVCTSENWLVLG